MKLLNNNIMNPIKNVAFVFVITVLLVGCDDFGSLNMDSNNPSEVRTDLLLTGAQNDMSDVVAAATPVIWTQYITETQYDDVPRYNPTEANFNSWYYNALQDLQTIIDLNSDEETSDEVALSGGSNANQIAVARIMKVYFFQMITDRWGDVPYSEALQGRENLSPAYDSQEDIYADMVVELQEAVEQMDSGAGVSGDILFEGDMEQWALFGNSLRARVALRMADAPLADPSLAETHFADAVDGGLITEDVMYPYLADADNENPWYTRFRTRTDYAISDVIGDYMLDLEDNRILVYANPAPDEDNENGVVEFSEIVPMDYDEAAPGDVTNSSISFPGDAIGAGGEGIQDAPLPIITVAELEFAQAEAVERGWITGSAADHYNTGIEASWNQWGVFDAADFAAYIATPEVAYSSADWEEKIGTQKWVALYPNGYEAYAEWRRLDYPELEPHDRALTESGEIPVRFTYPATEAEINTASYEAAVSAQGPDTPDTHVWWDVD